MTIKIEGKRIVIRQPKISDAKDIYSYAKDREISRYTSVPHPYSLKHAKQFIARSHKKIKKKSGYDLVIVLKETNQFIGTCGLTTVDKENKKAELGYWIGKPFWGQGFASEATKLLLDFGFNKMKLHRIYARVFAPNKASVNVLEKCGFKLEGRLRQDHFRNGKWLDHFMYGILKDEYNK